MRLHGDQLFMRLSGSVLGAGFCLFGAFAMFGADTATEVNYDRAFWHGVTLIVAGIFAVAVSWTAKNLDDIWCRPPKRWDN